MYFFLFSLYFFGLLILFCSSSFGYCEKVEIRGHKPVGQYGNGFKSGSMRLGKDAIVFTKCKTTWSVGFLSQTFLAAINSDTVLVPIITFDKATNILCCLTSMMTILFCLNLNAFQ